MERENLWLFSTAKKLRELIGNHIDITACIDIASTIQEYRDKYAEIGLKTYISRAKNGNIIITINSVPVIVVEPQECSSPKVRILRVVQKLEWVEM